MGTSGLKVGLGHSLLLPCSGDSACVTGPLGASTWQAHKPNLLSQYLQRLQPGGRMHMGPRVTDRSSLEHKPRREEELSAQWE